VGDGDVFEQLVDTANALFGAHPRTRALHAKGMWCEGTFTATADAARLSRAAHLQGDPIPALTRFSNGGGKPNSNDAAREARGLALKLSPPGGADTDILATTTPVFVARTPEDFLELLQARLPDPQTGEPDMEKLGAYLGAHPEAQLSIQSTIGAEPPASFATVPYYSPHSFKLVDADGNEAWVRYRWRPEAGEERIADDVARKRGRDYLQEELRERLAAGPVRFELQLQLAAEGDPIEDATAMWPPERELIGAGTLEVAAVIADPEASGDVVVFDPTRVIDGVELSADPILHARPRAYSVSVERRATVG
jgi:catalase